MRKITLIVQGIMFFDVLAIWYMWFTGVLNETLFLGLIVLVAVLLLFLIFIKGMLQRDGLAAVFYALIASELALFVYGYFHSSFVGCNISEIGLLHPWGIDLSTAGPMCQILTTIYPLCLVAIDAFIVTVVGGLIVFAMKRSDKVAH